MSAGLLQYDNMMSVRQVPWHGMGVVLDEAPKSIDEAIQAAGLDWEVVQKPVHFEIDGGEFIPFKRPGADDASAFVNVRADTGEALAVVGDKYQVLQNREGFSFLGNLIGSEMHFETAGSLGNGRRTWVLAKLPEHIEVGGDDVDVYVLVSNSHDGYRAIKASVTPIRVVCQNTLTMGENLAKRTYAMPHLGDPQTRLVEARKVLDLSVNFAAQFKQLGDRLASEKMTERMLQNVLKKLYPTDGPNMTDRKVENREGAKAHILHLFKEGTVRKNDEVTISTVGNAPGTKWAGLNAITEYVDWGYKPDSDDPAEGGNFTRAFDDPTRLKHKAYELVAANN